MKRILVPLVDGVEEMEAVVAIDTLRRAGFAVDVAGLRSGGEPALVTASRGVRLLPDCAWPADLPGAYDALVLPGGKGVAQLRAEVRVVEAVRAFDRAGRWVCAICAAPLVLQDAGVLAGCRAACFPGVSAQLTSAVRVEDPVVVDGRIITSRGAGTSLAFALEIVRQLAGAQVADDVAAVMVAAWRST